MKLTKTTILASTLLSLFATAQTATAAGQAPDDKYTPFIEASALSESDAKDKKVLYMLDKEDSVDVADDYFTSDK